MKDLIDVYGGNVKLIDDFQTHINELIPGTFIKIGVANGYLDVYALKYGDIKSYVGYFVI
jgi:hypothetical protein